MLWIFFPITLSLVSFIGTWSVTLIFSFLPLLGLWTVNHGWAVMWWFCYSLAYSSNHVCSLSDWSGNNYCTGNNSNACCYVPTISASGMSAPENSLFTATINAGSFLFLLFCIFHHAHLMEKHACYSLLSKTALVFGVISSVGSFAAGNCNMDYLPLLHYLGAAVSFTCICFYTILLTALTKRCVLTGYEKVLYPLRIGSTVVQIIVTICYTILFSQEKYFYIHLAAVFEWMLSVNLELFELSYTMEFLFFSSFMISNLLSRREEEKPLILTMS